MENDSNSILHKRSWLTIMITYRCAEPPELNEQCVRIHILFPVYAAVDSARSNSPTISSKLHTWLDMPAVN